MRVIARGHAGKPAAGPPPTRRSESSPLVGVDGRILERPAVEPGVEGQSAPAALPGPLVGGRPGHGRSSLAGRRLPRGSPGRSTGGSVAAVFVERLSSANSARRAVIYDPAFGPSVAPSPEPASTQRLCPPGECSMLPPPNRRTRPRMYVVNHVALLVADPKRRPVAPDSTVGKRTDRPTDDGIPTCVLQLDRA